MTIAKYQPEKEWQESEQRLAFEELYQQYQLRIYRYLRAHLKNADDAADLTQQVFFQVWLCLPTYQRERGAFSTWIFSIARHRLIDFLRARRAALSWETLYEIAISDLNPEEMLISAEIIAQVEGLIAALSPAERELLALRFAARLSIAEIARLIGKSEEATKKQLARLLRRLQERYQRLDEQIWQPDLWERQVPAFFSVLHQIYAVALPVAWLTFLHQRSQRTWLVMSPYAVQNG